MCYDDDDSYVIATVGFAISYHGRRTVLAQLVVCRRRSCELASSIPAMVDFADIVATGSPKP